ncbi:PucR family transcriptional regulator [Streptomyces sp. NPDC088387]|uniref:PucR family transcriptional regulator n=1 Tax=Streptomyces sp. NPDC088387 TaxID=3365859 RepID=UPI00382287B5
MHVEHLLTDESLGLRLLWAKDALLREEISGVTVTDLEDPARFVRAGEVVLSGLVWWTPQDGHDRAERFVSALKDAGAAVLLAGEETHGSVPETLVEACVRHDIPVAAVPAHIMFRTVTERVYLQQWGDLSRHHALPDHVRDRLGRLLAQHAGPDEILTTAFAHVTDAAVAYVLTPTGRTVAATPNAHAVSAYEVARLLKEGAGATGATGAAVAVDSDSASAYERWRLYLPGAVPPRLLHEVAAILGRCQESQVRRRAAGEGAVDRLGALLVADAGRAADAADSYAAVERGPGAVEGGLRACGMPTEGPYRVVTAATSVGRGRQGGSTQAAPTGAREGVALAALREVIAYACPGPAAMGNLPDGTAFAVLPETAEVAALDVGWRLVAAHDPAVLLHGGIGSPAATPGDLPGALTESRYALASSRGTTPDASLLTDATTLTTLDTLLTGVPAAVRATYSRTVLGPLLDTTNASAGPLLETLRTFLACDGSWARTAEVLHLHVNTVHYRVQRIEHFTGRDLSRLADRIDLWSALMCGADAAATGAGDGAGAGGAGPAGGVGAAGRVGGVGGVGGVRGVPGDRRTRSSTSRAR